MKKNLSTILLAAVFVTGLSLLLYPTVSNYWNSFHQTRAIESYTEAVQAMDEEECEALLAEAERYNAVLAAENYYMVLPADKETEYEAQLQIPGSEGSAMCSIQIPKIQANLAVYPGTDEGMLQKYIGHMEASSLPVGGESTHCVLAGHRGLPSARLFTDIDQLVEGDIFVLNTLNRVLTYQVDQILIVLPEEVDALGIIPGQDLCTLVTCTPYGVNSHRLLVRGHRIENVEELEVFSEASQVDTIRVAIAIAAPILLTGMLIVLTRRPRRKKV